jgi:hypothetical protein
MNNSGPEFLRVWKAPFFAGPVVVWSSRNNSWPDFVLSTGGLVFAFVLRFLPWLEVVSVVRVYPFFCDASQQLTLSPNRHP